MTVSRQVEIPPYRFWETRAGRGTPVVLIHGLGGSADWWRRNVDALAAEHVVSAVDLVGFGRNRFFLRRSMLPLAFVDLAALLARWIESSFDAPVHVVGNSMGGHAAIHLAARRPDLVRSLTLVNSTGMPFELTIGPHVENLIVPRGALSFATVLVRDAFRSGPMSIGVAFARLLRDDARPLLENLEMPTLLLWGERDPLVPLTYARQMADLIPNARLKPVPNAGHIPMWENPEAFNRELLEFLREVDASPASSRASHESFAWTVSGIEEGMLFRESGRRRDVVLIHGLGMSAAYLERLACALFDRGLHSIAPDLPGFGMSPNAPGRDPVTHAESLIRWAEALKIRDAIWIGHSLGCNVVAHVARLRPDLVRGAVHVGPLWTASRHPIPRLFGCLLLDIPREDFALYRHVIASYWRCGFARWWTTFYRSLPDIRVVPARTSAPGLMLAGDRDPIPDRDTVEDLVTTPGAHACLFSAPAETADRVMTFAGADVMSLRKSGDGIGRLNRKP